MVKPLSRPKAKPSPKAVPPGVRVAFGQNLRAARQEAGLTQEQVADAAGAQRPYITQIESGLRNVSLELAESLARAVGKNLAELLPPTLPRNKK